MNLPRETDASSRYGGDPAAMRRAAYEFESQASNIQRCSEAVSVDIAEAWWSGPDADRFRAEWTQVHRQNNQKIVGRLRNLAGALRSEASNQERISDI